MSKTKELGEIFQSVTGTDTVRESQEEQIKRAAESDDPEEARGLPTTEVDCEICDNDTAYYYLQQTRAADEPETRFFICTSCNTTWREYD